MRKYLLGFIFALFLVIAPNSASAATIEVQGNDLQAAIAAVNEATDGDTIVLTGDINLEINDNNPIGLIINKDLTINLNGHNIEITYSNYYVSGIEISSNSNVTIQNGHIDSKVVCALQSYGNLTLENTSITSTGIAVVANGTVNIDKGSQINSLGDLTTIELSQDNDTTITPQLNVYGTINSKRNAIRCGDGTQVNIYKGANIITKNDEVIQNNVISYMLADINIYGGTIISPNLFENVPANLNIYGGTFISESSTPITVKEGTGSKISISGGIFNAEVNPEFLAEGAIQTENNGVYTIEAPVKEPEIPTETPKEDNVVNTENNTNTNTNNNTTTTKPTTMNNKVKTTVKTLPTATTVSESTNDLEDDTDIDIEEDETVLVTDTDNKANKDKKAKTKEDKAIINNIFIFIICLLILLVVIYTIYKKTRKE